MKSSDNPHCPHCATPLQPYPAMPKYPQWYWCGGPCKQVIVIPETRPRQDATLAKALDTTQRNRQEIPV